MGVSAAGLYDYTTDKLTIYEEENIQSLIKELESSTLVVGINLKRFSYKVLVAFSHNDFNRLKTLDVLEHFKKRMSFKPSIEGLYNGTLGINKIVRNEIYVPRLYKQGNIGEIKTLCQENILDLKKLFDYGKEKGYIVYDEKTPSGKIHIGSGRSWIIHDVIAKAMRNIGLKAKFILLYNFISHYR